VQVVAGLALTIVAFALLVEMTLLIEVLFMYILKTFENLKRTWIYILCYGF